MQHGQYYTQQGSNSDRIASNMNASEAMTYAQQQYVSQAARPREERPAFIARTLFHIVPSMKNELKSNFSDVVNRTNREPTCYSFILYNRIADEQLSHLAAVTMRNKDGNNSGKKSDGNNLETSSEGDHYYAYPKYVANSHRIEDITSQIMVIGKWDSRQAYEEHLAKRLITEAMNRLLISKFVYSFPKFTLWIKANGFHKYRDQGELAYSLDRTDINKDFVMCRTRNMHPRLKNDKRDFLVQIMIRFAQVVRENETGCLEYHFCLSDHPDTASEVLEIGIWRSKTDYEVHLAMPYMAQRESISQAFETEGDEITYWQTFVPAQE